MKQSSSSEAITRLGKNILPLVTLENSSFIFVTAHNWTYPKPSIPCPHPDIIFTINFNIVSHLFLGHEFKFRLVDWLRWPKFCYFSRPWNKHWAGTFK